MKLWNNQWTQRANRQLSFQHLIHSLRNRSSRRRRLEGGLGLFGFCLPALFVCLLVSLVVWLVPCSFASCLFVARLFAFLFAFLLGCFARLSCSTCYNRLTIVCLFVRFCLCLFFDCKIISVTKEMIPSEIGKEISARSRHVRFHTQVPVPFFDHLANNPTKI